MSCQVSERVCLLASCSDYLSRVPQPRFPRQLQRALSLERSLILLALRLLARRSL